MSEDERCQDRTRCTDNNREKPLSDCLWITQERIQRACVPQSSATGNHLFHRKAGERNRAIFSWEMKESEGFVCPELLWRPGEGAGRVHQPTWEVVLSGWRPKGKPSGSRYDRSRHIESNVTDSGASSGGCEPIQTESVKCWIDRCLKPLLARFHLIHLSYQPKAQSGAAAKESITSLTSWDTNDFSYLPEFNFGGGYVHFSTTRKWLNKPLKR